MELNSPFLDILNIFSDLLVNLDNNAIAPTIAPIKAVTPVTPFATPFQSNEPSLTNADDKIRIAVAIPIIIVAAFIAPTPITSILLNSAIAPINSPNNILIAVSDDVNLPGSILDKIKSDAARIPIADAILIRVPACIFCCQLFNESSTVPRTSFIWSINFIEPSKESVIPFMYFLIPNKIVANKPPLRISRSDFASPLLIASPNALPIEAARVPIVFPTFWITPHIPFIKLKNHSKPDAETFAFIAPINSLNLSIADPRKPTMLSIALPNRFVSVIEFAILLTKLPSAAVMDKIPPLTPVTFPINVVMPETMLFIIVTPTLITENIPLNVAFNLGAFFSVNSLKPAVKFRIRSVMLSNCSEVVGGNISLNASLIGVMMFIRPSKAFLNESTIIPRPPASFQPCNILLRASADSLSISLRVSDTLVHISLASSKSPIRISHVCVHPD